MGYEVSRKIVLVSIVTVTIFTVATYFYFRNGNSSIIEIDENDNNINNQFLNISEKLPIINEKHSFINTESNDFIENNLYLNIYNNFEIQNAIIQSVNDKSILGKIVKPLIDEMHSVDDKHLAIIQTDFIFKLKDPYAFNYKLVYNFITQKGILIHPEIFKLPEFLTEKLGENQLLDLNAKFLKK
jgi:hypothetical protein